MEEKFEKFVNRREGERGKEHCGEAAGEQEGDHSHVLVRWFRCGGRAGHPLEQAIDASGEIAIASKKRSRKIRQARSGAHAGDVNERGGKRNGAACVSGRSLVVGGPLGELRPGAFKE